MADVASVLKAFLRKNPLIPPNMYVSFVAIARSQPHADFIARLLRTTSRDNQIILTYVCAFLVEVSRNEVATKMGVDNLATVALP